MPIPLYFDVHAPAAIAIQLQRRGVDVVTAVEDGSRELTDDKLLERAHKLRRVLFTQDIRFHVMALDWQANGRPFSGLAFGHQHGGTIGEYVADLELIAKASEIAEWENQVVRLPL